MSDPSSPKTPKGPMSLREDIVDGYGISKDFYFCLGMLTAEWARVEELLGILVFLLLGVKPESGWFLVANLGYRSRAHLLQALIDAAVTYEKKTLIGDVSGELKKISKEADALYAIRNGYVHGFYNQTGGTESAYLLSYRVKGKIKLTNKLVHQTQILDAYYRTESLRLRISAIVRQFDVTGFFHDAEPPEGAGEPETPEPPSPDPRK